MRISTDLAQIEQYVLREFSGQANWLAPPLAMGKRLTPCLVDGELRKVMLELPSFFQPSPEDRVPPSPTSDAASMVQYYEKTTLNLGLHSRMMRLHRPWLSRGYGDERFSYSKEQCIRAARAGLRSMCGGENKYVAQFLEKWW